MFLQNKKMFLVFINEKWYNNVYGGGFFSLNYIEID